ncbi:MAG: hypothetical protein COB79_00525 [Zetaproteobacteria bacterium]|nr:MAG: hypothetical protein COB79_00525 [Zetaproteobacteria bacterium]
MNIFKKKAPKPVISYLHISLNLTQIRAYLKNPSEISSGTSWDSDDECISHSIDLLLKDDIYYHQSLNQFSHTISSVLYLDPDIGQLEWNIYDNIFVVNVLHKENGVLFCCPLNEIQILINGGKVPSKNLLTELKEGTIIELENPCGYCEKYHRRKWMSHGITYSNDLVSFNFSKPSSSHIVEYK